MASLTAAPEEIKGHGLLTGKVVVVTAAAGTGIGSATARRALAEGAGGIAFPETDGAEDERVGIGRGGLGRRSFGRRGGGFRGLEAGSEGDKG